VWGTLGLGGSGNLLASGLGLEVGRLNERKDLPGNVGGSNLLFLATAGGLAGSTLGKQSAAKIQAAIEAR
jgi:hypothetical protein